ncbi:MAG: Gldg family protein [bacterium]
MKHILTITKKELRAYFNSPIAYITITVYLVLVNWLAFQSFFIEGQANIRYFLGIQPWVFLLFVPAVSMRVWAEEKRQATFEVLMTFPVRDLEVVWGKFLAGFIFLAVSLALTLPLPFTANWLGNLDWGPVIGGYLGALLMGTAYLAIGLFASSLTVNQIIAFITGTAISFGFLIIGQEIFLFSLPNYLADFFRYTGLGSHFISIRRGVIDTRDLCYFFSLIFLFLTLNIRVIESRFWSKAGKKGKLVYSGNLFVSVGMLLGVIVAVNLLSRNFFTRFDLTQQKEYTLSRATRRILANLDDTLTITGYFSRDLPSHVQPVVERVKDMLDEYKAYGGSRVRTALVDPADDQTLQEKLRVLGIPMVQLNIIERDQAQIKDGYMGISLMYEGRSAGLPVIQNTKSLEYELTAAIRKLRNRNRVTIGFYSERAGYKKEIFNHKFKMAINSLKNEYQVFPVKLKEQETLLENVNLLILAGPVNLPESALFAVDQFIMRGGKVLFLLDHLKLVEGTVNPVITESGLEPLLEHYGLKLKPDVIADATCKKASFTKGYFNYSLPYPYWVKVERSGMNQGNAALRGLESFVFPWTRSLEPLIDAEDKERKFFPLAYSSKFSQAQTSPRPDLNPNSPILSKMTSPGAVLKRYLLAAAVSGRFESYYKAEPDQAPRGKKVALNSPETQIAVVGNSKFIQTDFIGRVESNNQLFMNIVDWMSNSNDLIEIRSRAVTDRPLVKTTATEKFWIRSSNIYGVSLLLVMLGLIRFYRRRFQSV